MAYILLELLQRANEYSACYIRVGLDNVLELRKLLGLEIHVRF